MYFIMSSSVSIFYFYTVALEYSRSPNDRFHLISDRIVYLGRFDGTRCRTAETGAGRLEQHD